MNIHHLELFYFVARHGGITEAVRNIPYGIQQPAVSGQVAQLEEFLGVTLFQRRPFQLTAAGEKLYKFIQPFFANLDALAAELQGGKTHYIRLGASTIILRDHIPQFLQNIRKRYSALRVSLREGYHAELELLLEQEEIDLAITLIEKKTGPGIQAKPLIDVPLVLLAPKHSRITSPEQLWKADKITETLICLPGAETLSKHFQQGLSRLGVDWFPGIEVSSIDLIEAYVAAGFGIGLTVLAPKSTPRGDVRALPLPSSDFVPITIGALWRGRPSALIQAFLDELQLRAKRLA